MPGIRTILLSESQRQSLEQGFREGRSHWFRQRCQAILLKSSGYSARDVAQRVGLTEQSIHAWIKRYESEGLAGLQTRPGRGRKACLDLVRDGERVRKVVQDERQRLRQAKAQLEADLNKQFSVKTLKRFLKNLSADTNAFPND